MTEQELLLRVARLDGYLDAIASADGRFREHVIRTSLLPCDGGIEAVRAAVAARLSAWPHREWTVASIKRLDRWLMVEHWLRDLILIRPFGLNDLRDSPQVRQTRYELAWQATDAIENLFLPNPRPNPEAYLLELIEPHLIESTGYAIELYQQVLLIHHTRWRPQERPRLKANR